jgi:hypothetical protein
VIHDILLSKLIVYGICGKVIMWLKAYLEGRKQRVEIYNSEKGKSCSGWETIKYGVPQGSILGLLLFLIYINDLSLGLNTDIKLLLYAYDTSVLILGDNMHEIQTKSRHVLNSLNHWCTNNGLSLNLKKTKVLKFETTKRGNMSLQLYYNNEVLYDAMNIKLLGLEIDVFKLENTCEINVTQIGQGMLCNKEYEVV